MWLAILHRLWTSDRRVRHGQQDEISHCHLCDQEEDTIEHILMQCVFARQVWHLCFMETETNLSLMPTGQDPLQEWWNSARKRATKAQRKDFDAMVMLVCWCIWKQRNERVFGTNDICNERGTFEVTMRERHLWAIARRGGVQLNRE